MIYSQLIASLKKSPAYVVVAVLLVCVHIVKASHQVYPGTDTRLILSESEAFKYDVASYLNNWEPEKIDTTREPDYVITPGQSIQKVVNEAIRTASSERRYIRIEPGTYKETVYIKSSTPITIYGGGNSANDVIITQEINADIFAPEYMNLVNPDGSRYKEGDPAWDLYYSCIKKTSGIGSCSAVLWAQNDDFQLTRVTVQNTAVRAQAVAIKIDGDKVHVMNNNFLSAQDTVYVGARTDIQRIVIHMCYIEGDVDFICGPASTVIKSCTIKVVGTRNKSSAVIFAPSTPPDHKYGFLVIDSTITGDETFLGYNKVKLARAWDTGISDIDDYVPGSSPNGQLVIRDTQIDKIINVDAPYNAATSTRPFTTDLTPNRDLDDNTHNRMWEYNNYGDDA